MSGEPITKCPVCRYDLTGLPKNHTCPECGFEYDETMRIWHAWKPSFVWAFFLFIPCFVVLFSITKKLTHVSSMMPVPAQIYLYALLPALFLLANCIFLVPTLRRNRSWMVASHSGLHLFRDDKTSFTPWGEITVPPPSDGLLRPPIAGKEFRSQPFGWRFWRILRQDVGGLNFHVTVFSKGDPPKPLRLPFVSPSRHRRRTAYEVIFRRWSESVLSRPET